MKHAILIAVLALAAAPGLHASGRDACFWRLESEGSYSISSPPYTTEQEGITYYYNTSNSSQLDSMRLSYYNSQAGAWTNRSCFSRTNHTDYYVIEENLYHETWPDSPYLSRVFRKTYNWQDQLLLVQNYTGSMQLLDRYEYEYDAQGNQVSERYYTNNTLDRETLSSYNDDDLLTWYRLQTRHWQTEQMFTLREEEHFYSVHTAPDSSEIFIQSESTGSLIPALIDRQYNDFDAHGNVIHRLDLLFRDPDKRGLRDPWERNTYTQYIPGLLGWLPSQELSYGTFVNVGWTISCSQDSTLATYSYSYDFLQENYAWQSFITQNTQSRTTNYNEAGLKTSQSGEYYQGSYSSSSTRYWNWVYVNTEVEDPQTPAVQTELSCAPNPFRESLGLKLASEAGPFQISIFNVRGQLVRVLVEGSKESGEYFSSWDGKDKDGNRLPSGVYVIRARTASQEVLARVSLFR
jgi:hypothetical protein